MKKIWILLAISLLVAGCRDRVSDEHTIRVGTIAGPETELMEVAQKQLDAEGIHLEIVTFSDYAMPNTALHEGSIDANVFQHLPYLDAAAEAKGFKFAVVGKTFIYPMALYSQRHQTLVDFPMGAKVAIPNDPTNEARALLLLEKAGIIGLREGAGALADVSDVVNNPRGLEFLTLSAAQLPRTLVDVDGAVINTNYAVPAGLLPKRDGIVVEEKQSLYANIIVVREREEAEPKYQKLVEALQSEAVVKAADERFQSQAIPAWR